MLFGVTRWHIRLRIRKPPVVGSNPTAGCIWFRVCCRHSFPQSALAPRLCPAGSPMQAKRPLWPRYPTQSWPSIITLESNESAKTHSYTKALCCSQAFKYKVFLNEVLFPQKSNFTPIIFDYRASQLGWPLSLSIALEVRSWLGWHF